MFRSPTAAEGHLTLLTLVLAQSAGKVTTLRWKEEMAPAKKQRPRLLTASSTDLPALV